MAEFKYEIVEEIGVISENAKGWRKELNRISWNGKMGKGVTLSDEEVVSLKEILSKL